MDYLKRRGIRLTGISLFDLFVPGLSPATRQRAEHHFQFG
jgi:hypothetical protein